MSAAFFGRLETMRDEAREELAALSAQVKNAPTPLLRAVWSGRLGDRNLHHSDIIAALRAFEDGLSALDAATSGRPDKELPGKSFTGPRLPPYAALGTVSAEALPEVAAQEPALGARLRLGAGQAYLLQGQYAPARHLLEAAAATSSLPSELRGLAWLNVAGMAFDSVPRDLPAVRAAAEKALEADTGYLVRYRAALLLARVETGRDALKALEAYIRVVRLAREAKDRAGEAVGLGLLAELLPDTGYALARAAVSRVRQAGERSSLSRTRYAAGRLAAAAGDFDAAARELRNALLELGVPIGSAPTEEGRVTLVGMGADIRDTLVDVELNRGEVVRALEAAEDGRGAGLEMGLVQRDSSPHRAFVGPRLVYHVGAHRTVLFYVESPREVRVHLCPWGAEELAFRIAGVFRALRVDSELRGIRSVGWAKPAPDVLPTPLEALYHRLIEPFEVFIPDDGRPLILEPDGPLWSLPFAALPDRHGAPLGARVPILLCPSPRVTSYLQRLAPSPFQGKALIVGNPIMPEVDGLELDALPGAEAEAQAIAARLGSSALVGAEATGARVLERLSQVSVIHLATHAASSPDNPNDAFLALAPAEGFSGRLTVQALRQRDLHPGLAVVQRSPALPVGPVYANADLAVLSACQTGVGSITDEGVIGLCRTFLAIGVRTVVASLWSVDDGATRALMEGFYSAWREGAPPVVAMMKAANEVRKAQPDPRFWAPFVVLGSGLDPRDGGIPLKTEEQMLDIPPTMSD